MATNKKLILNTPVGTARFPWLTAADTKFNVNGEYKTDLVFNSEDELSGIIPALDKMLASFADEQRALLKPADAKKLSVVPFLHNEEDAEGEETGRVFLRFKLKALVEMKNGKSFTQKPNGFDAAGKPLPENVAVYGGSQIKINFEAAGYYNAKDKAVGLTLRLRAFKVIELSGGTGGASANSYGFGDAEEGYVAPKDAFESDNTPEQDDDF
jgi:hypothetical protein